MQAAQQTHPSPRKIVINPNKNVLISLESDLPEDVFPDGKIFFH